MQRRFIFVFLFCSSLLFSQTRHITLENALSLALESNISLQREKISLEGAERASKHSWNAIFPSISAVVSDEITLSPSDAEEKNVFSVAGKAEMSISASYFASMKKTRLDYEASRISFDEAVSEVLSKVKEMYFTLLYEEQNLSYLRDNLEAARLQSALNAEKYRKGTLSELEYLSSKVSCESLKSELRAQEVSHKNNLSSFALFLGLPFEAEVDSISLEGNLEDFIKDYASFFSDEMKALIEKDVKDANVPSLLFVKKQLESAKKDVSVSRLSAFGPTVTLGASLSPVFSGADSGKIKSGATASISLPLDSYFGFSKGADSVRSAKDSVRSLELQLLEKSRAACSEYSMISGSILQKEESVSFLKDYALLAQKNYDVARFAYSKGVMEFLSLQNAAKENLSAKLKLQNEFLEYLKLYVSLEKLCGRKCPAVFEK